VQDDYRVLDFTPVRIKRFGELRTALALRGCLLEERICILIFTYFLLRSFVQDRGWTSHSNVEPPSLELSVIPVCHIQVALIKLIVVEISLAPCDRSRHNSKIIHKFSLD